MGGGDLNLKKSWHPSTMKNMEKVWKAEQQDTQEKKRIAELKKELAMERDREEMTSFAMEQGVIEKKEDKKLDWMYKRPHEMVNREDYLLGKAVDKNFQLMVQSEKAETNQAPKNHVEHECIPPSLRYLSGTETVDSTRKQHEDPLYLIRKKQMDNRAQLLNNPVKLKQITEMVKKLEKKNTKKVSKSERHSNKSHYDDNDLDDLLAAKVKKLKGKINREGLINSVKKHKIKKSKKKRSRSSSSSSSSDSDSDSSESDSSSSSDDSSRKRSKKYTKRKDKKMKSSHKQERDKKVDKKKKYKTKESSSDEDKGKNKHRASRNRERDESQDSKNRRRNFGLMRADGSKISPSRETKQEDKVERKEPKKEEKPRWVPRRKPRFTEEERKRRHEEMLSNAVWRQTEREKSIRKHEEKEKRESEVMTFDKDFMRKQFACVSDSTLESRIKSRVNNIQRSKSAMDTNFARR